jgi:hypothetical protein
MSALVFTIYATREDGGAMVWRTTDEREANRLVVEFGGTITCRRA